MADALDSKSSGLRAVWVQLPPPVLEVICVPIVGSCVRPIPTGLAVQWTEFPKGPLAGARFREGRGASEVPVSLETPATYLVETCKPLCRMET